MAFKEVTDLNPDTTVSLGGTNKKTGKANAKQVEGYFLGSRKVEDRKKKSGFSYIHVFQTSKGNLGVWGKTDLDRKMLGAAPGAMTRVTVTGTVPTPNGDMYKFKVEIDADNSVEVNAPAEAQEVTAEGYNDDAVIDNDDEDNADAYSSGADTSYDIEEAPAPMAASSANKARVEALLKKRK